MTKFKKYNNINILAIANMLKMEKEKNIIKIFSCQNKLKILLCLIEKKTVTEIIENCNISQSAVSQHLKKLKELNLVNNYKKGRFIYYELKDKKIGQIAKLILNYLKTKK